MNYPQRCCAILCAFVLAGPVVAQEMAPSLSGRTMVKVDPHAHYKVVYDIHSSEVAAGISKGLYYARGLIEAYRKQGVEAKQLDMHLVLHGDAAQFLLDDETERVMLTNMVACLFARGVYKPERVAEALDCLGYKELAQGLMPASEGVRRERWRLKIATGFDPMATKIPKRFSEITTWKGPVDPDYMEALRKGYAARIAEFGGEKTATS